MLCQPPPLSTFGGLQRSVDSSGERLIGSGSTILSNITENAIVGAGCVVTSQGRPGKRDRRGKSGIILRYLTEEKK